MHCALVYCWIYFKLAFTFQFIQFKFVFVCLSVTELHCVFQELLQYNINFFKIRISLTNYLRAKEIKCRKRTAPKFRKALILKCKRPTLNIKFKRSRLTISGKKFSKKMRKKHEQQTKKTMNSFRNLKNRKKSESKMKWNEQRKTGSVEWVQGWTRKCWMGAGLD